MVFCTSHILKFLHQNFLVEYVKFICKSFVRKLVLDISPKLCSVSSLFTRNALRYVNPNFPRALPINSYTDQEQYFFQEQTVTLSPLVCAIHSLPVVHTLYMLFPTSFKNGEFGSVKPRATDAPICYKNKLWKNAMKKDALEACFFFVICTLIILYLNFPLTRPEFKLIYKYWSFNIRGT